MTKTITINPVSRVARSLRRASLLIKTSPIRGMTGGVAITKGRAYVSGYGDSQIEGFAHEDGNAAVHDPATSGENIEPHGIYVINEAQDANSGLIAADFRDGVQNVARELEQAIPVAELAEQDALDKIDIWGKCARVKVRLENKIKAENLAIPHWRTHLYLAVCLFGLVWGDLPVIAKGFELLQLSDQPLIPGVHLTDELHLAALASVSAILILAHMIGHKLRLVAHALDQRRLVTDKAARNDLPRPSGVALFASAVGIVFAVLLLRGVGGIRSDFLRLHGLPGENQAFLYIQLGVLAAAIAVSYLHAHPYGKEWANAHRSEATARKDQTLTERIYVNLVGLTNGLIDELDARLAIAGHHVNVSQSDARRQGHLYSRRVILSQPERAIEKLLPNPLPRPADLKDAELAGFLIGVTPIPTFGRLGTAALVSRREEIRLEVRGLAADSDGVTANNSADETGSEVEETEETEKRNGGSAGDDIDIESEDGAIEGTDTTSDEELSENAVLTIPEAQSFAIDDKLGALNAPSAEVSTGNGAATP